MFNLHKNGQVEQPSNIFCHLITASHVAQRSNHIYLCSRSLRQVDQVLASIEPTCFARFSFTKVNHKITSIDVTWHEIKNESTKTVPLTFFLLILKWSVYRYAKMLYYTDLLYKLSSLLSRILPSKEVPEKVSPRYITENLGYGNVSRNSEKLKK